MSDTRSKGKVVIIGNGFVGASTAFALMTSNMASEIVLIDVNKEKSIGEALDLGHGLPFVGQQNIYSGEYSDIKDADVIIVTAGAARKPGETRLDLAKKNASIIRSIIKDMMPHYNTGVFIVVSNPVDVLTYVIQKETGLPASKVIGSGTVLDSARFRYSLSQKLDVDVRNVHAYIIGEHGDSAVPVWSSANIAGEKVEDFCCKCLQRCGELDKDQIFADTKDAGAKIIQYKGATYYGIALSVTRIAEAILKNQNSVLTVGSVISGNYGINDVALSLPSIVNANGIEKIFDISLNDKELALLQASAAKIKDTLDQVK